MNRTAYAVWDEDLQDYVLDHSGLPSLWTEEGAAKSNRDTAIHWRRTKQRDYGREVYPDLNLRVVEVELRMKQ